MWFGLFLVLVAVPLLELALLIKLGQWIGFWLTILVIMATAVLGSWILHAQGFAAFRRATDALSDGRPPIEPVVDGMMLTIAGVLLLAPGLITDVAGLLLLIPPLRRWLGAAGFRRMLAAGTFRATVFTSDRRGGPANDTVRPGADADQPAPPPGTGPVIEGEFERIDETTKDPKPRH
jgi:UPF0716 protein FxsA